MDIYVRSEMYKLSLKCLVSEISPQVRSCIGGGDGGPRPPHTFAGQCLQEKIEIL